MPKRKPESSFNDRFVEYCLTGDRAAVESTLQQGLAMLKYRPVNGASVQAATPVSAPVARGGRKKKEVDPPDVMTRLNEEIERLTYIDGKPDPTLADEIDNTLASNFGFIAATKSQAQPDDLERACEALKKLTR